MIDKFNLHNLHSNERLAESLNRGRVYKSIGVPIIRNELREHQISTKIVAAAMSELEIDWFELVVKEFEKNMWVS
jgi:SOS response regulatory protein OraA/RecX